MRRLAAGLLFGCLGLWPLVAQAQAGAHEMERDVPRNIHWGLDLLHRDAYEDAEKQILSDSSLPANGNLAALFRSSRQQYGQYQGFDLVSSQAVTPRLRILHVALEYEKAPVFLRVVVYRTADGWVVLVPLTTMSVDAFESMTLNRPAEPPQ